MTVRAKQVLVAALFGAAGVMGFGTPAMAAGATEGAAKLEGAWVAKVPGTPMQWSYVVAPNASGRRASIHGTIEVGLSVADLLGMPELATNRLSQFVGTVAMTGPNTARFTSVWYGVRTTPGPFTSQIVYIGMNTGELEMFAPGKSKVTNNLAFYLPTDDEDGDGYPDAGKAPLFVLPPTFSVDTLLALPR